MEDDVEMLAMMLRSEYFPLDIIPISLLKVEFFFGHANVCLIKPKVQVTAQYGSQVNDTALEDAIDGFESEIVLNVQSYSGRNASDIAVQGQEWFYITEGWKRRIET